MFESPVSAVAAIALEAALRTAVRPDGVDFDATHAAVQLYLRALAHRPTVDRALWSVLDVAARVAPGGEPASAHAAGAAQLREAVLPAVTEAYQVRGTTALASTAH
jgi:hypothetical protein